MTDRPDGLPSLDELAGEWHAPEELAHLPSLRNQIGQAHVNKDLTSLSWLALPPYTVGYHTGVLRVNGRVPAAAGFRWSPWGVERRGASPDGRIVIETDTRLEWQRDTVCWRTQLTNDADTEATVVLEQELIASVASSEVDWGWLYGTPWNNGRHHDFYATERLREEVLAESPEQVQLLATDLRAIRLGRPRNPGIQRDEDSSEMLLESELPDHTSPDSGRVRPFGIFGQVRGLEHSTSNGDVRFIGEFSAVHSVTPDSDVKLSAVAMGPGASLRFEFKVDATRPNGVILTHGNHPDSLQIGLDAGVAWLSIGGERISAVEPVRSGVWTRIEVRVDREGATLAIDDELPITTAPWWGNQRWTASDGSGVVVVADSESRSRSAYGFSVAPDAIRVDGARAFATWELLLPARGSATIGIGLEIGADEGVERRARDLAESFDTRFGNIAENWRRAWLDAFTPGNGEFSGHLPTLVTDDADLRRTYYFGGLLAIYMRNTRVSPLGPVFLTGGPRLGATTTFYWDQSEWARTAAMLEPTGMRAWILAALNQPYESSHSFDTKNLVPTGNHYAANDHALFHIVESYVGVTGDVDILQAEARGETVGAHLRRLAYRPVVSPARFGEGVLFDAGRDAWELLECVGSYRDAVVSFSAGYVGMLRSFAEIMRLGGDDAAADDAAEHSARLAQAVLGQYAGRGRWNIAHPEGNQTIGHCLDFVFVADNLSDELSPLQRQEMVDFVAEHLISGDWMRALSPDDPVAPQSDRPDHGAAGAFAAWPGRTALGLCRLGRVDLAIGVLQRAHRTTSGALWGQAMEAADGDRYRVAERGVSNRESNAAIAVTEAVIAGVFGIRADFNSLLKPSGVRRTRFGELRNIRAVGFDGADAEWSGK